MKLFAVGSVVLSSMLAVPSFAEDAEGIRTLDFPEGRVVCIRDAAMRFPQSLFTDTGSGRRQQADSYESSVNVFLVQRQGKKMLVDAGNDPSRGSLRGKLFQAGIRPEEISDIFITHIHPDHVGGLLWNGEPLFPKATVHIAHDELEAWRKDAGRSRLAMYLEPYEARIHSFEYGKDLPGGLRPEKRAGHTPGHTIFRMTLGDGNEAVFIGDIVHAAELQFPFPTFCARFDMSPGEAVASRIETLRMQGILFGAHIPFPGVAQGGIVSKGAPDWSFIFRKTHFQNPCGLPGPGSGGCARRPPPDGKHRQGGTDVIKQQGFQ